MRIFTFMRPLYRPFGTKAHDRQNTLIDVRCWTFDIQRSLVSFPIRLDAGGQRRRWYCIQKSSNTRSRVGWNRWDQVADPFLVKPL